MTDNVVPLPSSGAVFDLDAETRDPEDIKPPFVIKIGGREVTFQDPSEIDWRDLAAVEAPGQLLRYALSREDHEWVRKQSIEGWRFGKLMKRFYDHFGLEDKIRDAKRQAAFDA